MKLYIKYMVSLRCKLFVKNELEKLGINCVSVELGVVEIEDEIKKEQLKQFREALLKGGLNF